MQDPIINVLSEKKDDLGFLVRTEQWGQEGKADTVEIICAYTPEGIAIGPYSMAVFLYKQLKLIPELAEETHKMCSIGWSEESQTWFGWSPLVCGGFRVGSKVDRTCETYTPSSIQDMLNTALMSLSADEMISPMGFIGEKDGTKGIHISYTYPGDCEVASKAGTRENHFVPELRTWGRGEFTIETAEQAKEAAKAFADMIV